MTRTHKKRSFVVCLSNEGYAASLELRKIYVALRDTAAERNGLLRVVDESGEDYLYPADRFEAVDFPKIVRSRLPRWQPSHRNRAIPAAAKNKRRLSA